MTICSITAHAQCMLDRNTHSEHLMLIAFKLQRWCLERAWILSYSYFAYLLQLSYSLLSFPLQYFVELGLNQNPFPFKFIINARYCALRILLITRVGGSELVSFSILICGARSIVLVPSDIVDNFFQLASIMCMCIVRLLLIVSDWYSLARFS
jgi:hypothetical protein